MQMGDSVLGIAVTPLSRAPDADMADIPEVDVAAAVDVVATDADMAFQQTPVVTVGSTVAFIGEPMKRSGSTLVYGTVGPIRSMPLANGTISVSFPGLGTMDCVWADLVLRHGDQAYSLQLVLNG